MRAAPLVEMSSMNVPNVKNIVSYNKYNGIGGFQHRNRIKMEAATPRDFTSFEKRIE